MATRVSWIKADIQIRLYLNFIVGVKAEANFNREEVSSLNSRLHTQLLFYQRQGIQTLQFETNWYKNTTMLMKTSTQMLIIGSRVRFVYLLCPPTKS